MLPKSGEQKECISQQFDKNFGKNKRGILIQWNWNATNKKKERRNFQELLIKLARN